jgi:formylglycine-generating enzyme required for sulfatase activity/uncharacterized caspase-like protein
MKYALIVANNRYIDHELTQLKAPAADLHALANVLGDKSIGEFDDVISLINQTEGKVSRAISAFLSGKKPDDLVLIYFSGHGVLDDNGRLFLALKDTQKSFLKSTAISSSFIADEMDSCRSKRQILILDCCYSGAFGRVGKAGAQKAVTAATFEGNGFGRVVLTASSSTEQALEGDQVIKQTKLSLFTHFLVEGLRTGNADTDKDGYVSLDEWYEYAYAQVLSATPQQVPHKWSYQQRGSLIVAKNPIYELLKLEAAEKAVREKAELEATERAAHEKAEKEVAEKARLDLEAQEKQKIALEQAEREITERAVREKERDEAAEKVAREKAEKEAAEKAGLEAHEETSVNDAKEKTEDAATEDNAVEDVSREIIEEEPVERSASDDTEQLSATGETQGPTELQAPEIFMDEDAEQEAATENRSTTQNELINEKPVLLKNTRTSTIAGKKIIKNGFVGILALFVVFVAVIVVVSSLNNAPRENFVPTNIVPTSRPVEPTQPVNLPKPTERPTNTPKVEPAAQETNVSIDTTLSTRITDAAGAQMVLVPAGNFIMGSDNGDANERPAHTVHLNDYYIDKYEVTIGAYKACVTAKTCSPPQSTKFRAGDDPADWYDYYDVYSDQPVIFVDWGMATTFCEWRGARLPTEAEWEKAARGTDGNTYPWGDGIDRTFANIGASAAGGIGPGNMMEMPKAVGSFESGKSPYGAYDMVGNVWEWVADWYGASYYTTLGKDVSNPKGPEAGVYHVVKGGSYLSSNYFARSAVRVNRGPAFAWEDIGFRCARDATP